ncbi:hypothetical protein GOPIP_064_00580 [Gordonia polyisoprenivorans NBRC 16320 = JCM 10675]|uniref:Uncharacterized protein n=1 Tax=Gordonia polyisoprenivorans TaxID=84595 RepID=A0A846WQY2_9ACTN|nr:hypothetical protein [Gordonia polyisoprenivorans]NKY03909.1 hypothetical protein [Gordonia polyisoprenivorans]GAB24220.1 hypothetical protein GOPIP_064_00580 [Gordonia polyisoprenivorans NBRC 16320 = JCM 10675]
MYIVVRSTRIDLMARNDLEHLEVTTDLENSALATSLRAVGVGYADGTHCYINALWLRRQASGLNWHAQLDELLSFAASRNRFDGLYVRVPTKRRHGSPRQTMTA